MTVKTLTITQEAYDVLKRLKHEEESFSQLFKRIGAQHPTIDDICGILKQTPIEAEQYAQDVKDIRKRLNKDLSRRIERVRTRFKRTH